MFWNQFVPVLWYKTQQVDSLRNFLKTFDRASNYLPIPKPKPKNEIGSTKLKKISLHITIAISLSIEIDKIVYRSDLETTVLAPFPSKSFNYTAINFFLQKLSIFTIANAKFTISTRTDIRLRTSLKNLPAITMCSAITPGSRYDKSLSKLFGNVCCPSTMCSDVLSVHKKVLQSLSRSDYQCL